MSRKNNQENINRNDIILTKNDLFINIADEYLNKISFLLKKVLSDVRYNTFIQILRLAREKEFSGRNLYSIFEELNLGEYNENIGTDCYGLSNILKKELQSIGVYSYFIRFDAGGTLNNDYLINGHVALCIPRNFMGEKLYTILDPGMLISEPITFIDGKGTPELKISGFNIFVSKKSKDDLPYMISVNGRELFFDPYHIWENPNETLSKDLLSSIGLFKISKQNENGKPICYFRIDIKTNILTFKVDIGDNVKRLDITFDDFLNLEQDEDLYSIIKYLSSILGENDFKRFYQEILSVIRISKEYKNQVWARSTLNKTKTLINNL